MNTRDDFCDRLKRSAALFRRIASSDVAELLEKAAAIIAAGKHDSSLAVSLTICAAMRDHLPEQEHIAEMMRQAADWLVEESPDD